MSRRSVGLGAGRVVRMAVAIAALAAVIAPVRASAQDVALAVGDPVFPHADHQGLFPLCTGCHEGVETGAAVDSYPEPEACAACHDGVVEELVTWRRPANEPTNVVYDHVAHARDLVASGDPAQACASCHIAPGGERMAVADQVQLGTCLGCHAHTASDHLVDADCSSCHRPLGESGLDASRIQGLPVPPSHDRGSFLTTDHGVLASQGVATCATCHVRERCISCHVDGERDVIAAFPGAAADMELPPSPAHYSVPSSHAAAAWFEEHGAGASRATCATCHTSNDCAVCHVQPMPDAVRALPSLAEASAPGVGLASRAPGSHDSFFFPQAHGALAAADGASCATCHRPAYCLSCHDGPTGGRSGYHPSDFLARHSASAFGASTECASCHSTEAFCRNCHLQTGLATIAGGGPGHHDQGPVWLLRHGQAARQNLESCASCHRQIDCTQCHSTLGAFKISPHSAGFDFERAWTRSPRTCLACHAGNPLNGR